MAQDLSPTLPAFEDPATAAHNLALTLSAQQPTCRLKSVGIHVPVEGCASNASERSCVRPNVFIESVTCCLEAGPVGAASRMLLPQDVLLCSTALSMKSFGHTPLTHIASIVPHISAAQQAPNNNQCTRKFLRRHSCNLLRLHHCLHFCLPCSNFTQFLSQADKRGSGRRRRRARQRQRQRCGRRASWSPKLPSDQNSEQDILKQRLRDQHQQQNA